MTGEKSVVEEFGKLCVDAVIAHQLFTSLFEVDQKQLDLYSSVAPYCFGDLCSILHQHVILQFAKLTDPAKTGRHSNLSSNYILEEVLWPDDIREQLADVNQRLMGFRTYIEGARSKRIAHTDLTAHLVTRESLGGFPKNAEHQFLKDLQDFINIAYGHLTGGLAFQINPAIATDTHRLVRALIKSTIFDTCSRCGEIDRINAVLDCEQQMHGA